MRYTAVKVIAIVLKNTCGAKNSMILRVKKMLGGICPRPSVFFRLKLVYTWNSPLVFATDIRLARIPAICRVHASGFVDSPVTRTTYATAQLKL